MLREMHKTVSQWVWLEYDCLRSVLGVRVLQITLYIDKFRKKLHNRAKLRTNQICQYTNKQLTPPLPPNIHMHTDIHLLVLHPPPPNADIEDHSLLSTVSVVVIHWNIAL